MTTTTISPSPMVGVGQAAEGHCEEPDAAAEGTNATGAESVHTVSPGNRGTATYRSVDGEHVLPTDVHPQPARPRRGQLHGADDPWGWADSMRRRRAARGGAP